MLGYKKNYKLEKKFYQFDDMRELFRNSALNYRDRTAFIIKKKGKKRGEEPEYEYKTYGELYCEINNLGTALAEKGFAGERLAVVGENSYNWCLAYFTSACGNGVTVPIDKMLKKDEIESCLKRSHVKAVFCDGRKYKLIKEIMDEGNTDVKEIFLLDEKDGMETIGNLVEMGKALLDKGDRRYTDLSIDPDTMSFLLFTSGTTSDSKAVMLSHRNFMSCNYGMNCEEVFFPDDVSMMILPLNHCYGMSGLLTFLSQGITNTFCDGLRYIRTNMKEYGVTVIMSVPLLLENMYKKINKSIDDQGMRSKYERGLKVCSASEKIGIHIRSLVFKSIIDELGGKLRFIINGAAALDPEVSKFFNGIGILTVQGYGLTETAPTISSETYRYLKPGSCGKVMCNVEAKLIDLDEEGKGELIVRGDNVMLGYYDDPKATEEVLSDGWFHTGDLAYFDDDGFLYICGRKKNVIVMKNGKNVFPEEIENQINNLPYIDESMVFEKKKLTDVVLWVKAVYNKKYMDDNKLSAADLKEKFEEDLDHINKALPSYKMVRNNFLSEIPTIKTTTQKIKRRDEIKSIIEEIKARGLDR